MVRDIMSRTGVLPSPGWPPRRARRADVYEKAFRLRQLQCKDAAMRERKRARTGPALLRRGVRRGWQICSSSPARRAGMSRSGSGTPGGFVDHSAMPRISGGEGAGKMGNARLADLRRVCGENSPCGNGGDHPGL